MKTRTLLGILILCLAAWIQLITLVLGTGIGVGVTAYLGGAKWPIALLCGLGTGATNVYHALTDSPATKATAAPFPPTKP